MPKTPTPQATTKGEVARKFIKAPGQILGIVLLLLALAASAQETSYIGDDIRVGDIEYHVFGIQWIEQLSSHYPGNTRSQYLLVDMAIRNKDREPRTIPSLYLYDETTAKYEESANRFSLEKDKTKFDVAPFHLLQRLNPGAGVRGLAVFEVPKTHGYAMLLPSGWTHSEASPRLVKLVSLPTPAATK